MILRLFVVPGLVILTGVCASAAPSFDCKLARTTVETTICANAELGSLDARIAESYREALRRVRSQDDVAAALKREHAGFLAGREATLHWPDAADLGRYMRAWRTWLDAVGRSPSGLEGVWINGSGRITISTGRMEVMPCAPTGMSRSADPTPANSRA